MASLFRSSWSTSQLPSLTNKVFLVTGTLLSQSPFIFDPSNSASGLGGTTGIGFGITANLLQHDAKKVIMLSSNPKHADLAKQELHKYGDVGRVDWIKCDLANLREVDDTARRLREDMGRLDALILNAGLGVGKYGLSKDDIEHHFQVNHLSHMHLCLSLLPLLIRTASETHDARLVIQSSSLHQAAQSSTKFASISEINSDIGPSYLYNRSKLAVLLFMRELLARRPDLKEKNVFVNCTHPGAVSTTQQDQAIEAYGTPAKVLTAVLRPVLADPIHQGCLPALWAATSEDVKKDGVTGCYVRAAQS